MAGITLCRKELHSGVYALETKSPAPIYFLAAAVVAETRGDALIVDGCNRADPYPLVDVCKRMDLDPVPVLNKVHVSRAFTAHQFESIIRSGVSRMARVADVRCLGVMGPAALFRDENLDEYESKAMLGRCIRDLFRLSRERELVTLVVDKPLHSHLKRKAEVLEFPSSQKDLEHFRSEAVA